MTTPVARWSDLRLRILSAAVLAPLAIACIWATVIGFLIGHLDEESFSALTRGHGVPTCYVRIVIT